MTHRLVRRTKIAWLVCLAWVTAVTWSLPVPPASAQARRGHGAAAARPARPASRTARGVAASGAATSTAPVGEAADAAAPAAPGSLEADMAEMAQPEATPTTETAPAPSAEQIPAGLRDDQVLYEEEVGVEQAPDMTTPVELRDTDYFFVNFGMRLVWLPDFIQNLAVAYTGPHALNGAIAGQFNYRRNGFNFIAEVNYTGFGNEGYYRGNGTPDEETEYVRSQLGVIFGRAVFSWSFEILPFLALEAGIGIGLGGVVGNMYRQEANTNGQGGYMRCDGPTPGTGGYCEEMVEQPSPQGRLDSGRVPGGTYQLSYDKPNPYYFGDGGVPPVMLWVDLPHIALRFKPIRQIQARAEVGYNLYAFNFGFSVGYGF